jgi:hypothetical protein
LPREYNGDRLRVSLQGVQSYQLTITAGDLVEGQWFLHEPFPGLSWTLQVAAIDLVADPDRRLVRIVTTDPIRQVVDYPSDRSVRLMAPPDTSNSTMYFEAGGGES